MTVDFLRVHCVLGYTLTRYTFAEMSPHLWIVLSSLSPFPLFSNSSIQRQIHLLPKLMENDFSKSKKSYQIYSIGFHGETGKLQDCSPPSLVQRGVRLSQQLACSSDTVDRVIQKRKKEMTGHHEWAQVQVLGLVHGPHGISVSPCLAMCHVSMYVTCSQPFTPDNIYKKDSHVMGQRVTMSI